MALTTITQHSPRFFQLWFLLAIFVLLSSCLVREVSAQIVVNGQTYTNGLAIVNSPALGSTISIGSTTSFSIDVTGNGQISPDSSDANSTDTTRITYLAAYLISEQQFTNITVVQGSDFITSQPGSSVKQASFAVPSCASPGGYNLTIYEGSVINGTEYFAITPIPVRVTASRPGGAPCSTLFNNILPADQVSSPPPFQPWGISDKAKPKPSSSVSSGTGSSITSGGSTSTDSTTVVSTASASASTSGSDTSTSGGNTSDSSAASTSTTDSSTADASSSDTGTASASSNTPVTVTKTVDGQTATITVSVKPSTITKVFSSVRTQVTTLTESGTTEVLTTTVETLSTSTKVVESAPSTPPGFLPVVNSAPPTSSMSITAVAGLFALTYLLMM